MASTNHDDVTLNVKDEFELEYGYTYDYAMVFKVHDETAELTPKQKEYSMKTILNRFAIGGLETRMFYSVKRDEVYCKIRASLERLKKEADRLDYKLLLDRDELRRTAEKGVPSANIGRIVIEDVKGVSTRNPYESIYAKYDLDDRLQLLYKKFGPKRIPFRSVDRMKIIHSIVTSRLSLGGCGLDIHMLLHHKCILGFYPLHNVEEKEALKDRWVVPFQAPWNQPFVEIKDYYGEKVGLYFAWLGHYTTWLIAPSILGIAVAFEVFVRKDVNAKSLPAFGLFMTIWSTLYLEYWKRRNHTLAMEWGMVGFEDDEPDRPQYQGEEIPSPINGQMILWFSPANKLRRVALSLLFIFFIMLLVVAVVAGIFAFRYFTNVGQPLASKVTVSNFNIGPMIAGTLNAAQIQIMGTIYNTIALKLNDYENHRTETEYEDNLIAKTFMFQFVNSYASCFYVAFLKNLFVAEKCTLVNGVPNCMQDLCTTLGFIFVLRLTSGNFTEVFIPWAQRTFSMRKEVSESLSNRRMSVVEKQFFLVVYDTMGTFYDYAEMIIQFGYVTLFVVAFPLAPFLAFINNYVEIRVDAYRLSRECRRPEPRSAEDIGTWYHILEIMGLVSVITNAALITNVATPLPTPNISGMSLENVISTLDQYGTDSARVIWYFIAIEHFVILAKYVFTILVDDVPDDVQIQMKREAYLVSKLIYLYPDDDDAELIKGNKVRVDLTIFDDE